MTTSKPRVLITGAAGNVGTALWQGWEPEGRYDLTLTDVNPIEGAHSRAAIGDICDVDFIQNVCKDQDVLVHLVYFRADYDSERPHRLTEIGLHMLLFDNAVRAGVKKIVFASSNQASGWNALQDSTVKHHPEHISPTGWYGAMKAMAEVAGRWLVNGHGIHFISIRIGTFNGTSEPESIRSCSYLLSPADAANLFGCAVDYAGPEKFLITYGASDNVYGEYDGLLDLTSAKEVLGYKPIHNMMKYRDQF